MDSELISWLNPDYMIAVRVHKDAINFKVKGNSLLSSTYVNSKEIHFPEVQLPNPLRINSYWEFETRWPDFFFHNHGIEDKLKKNGVELQDTYAILKEVQPVKPYSYLKPEISKLLDEVNKSNQ